jgi:hypothetical protein
MSDWRRKNNRNGRNENNLIHRSDIKRNRMLQSEKYGYVGNILSPIG